MGLQSWFRPMGETAWLGLALFAVFLFVAPKAHHGSPCHRTTPAHCPSCVAAHSGADVLPGEVIVAAELPAADPLSIPSLISGDTWLPGATVGRAPPTLAS